MHRGWRWWLAGVVTLIAFLAVTWVVTACLPASWLKDANQRLLVGSGAGAAVAALVALWGKTFATAKAAHAEPESAARAASARTVTIAGNNRGIASAGDRARNIQGTDQLRGTPEQGSENPGRAVAGSESHDAWIQIGRDNDGIASAGDNTTNIQEGF